MQNYDSLIDRIVQSSGLEKEEIEKRVEARRAKLSGLISKEGAAQIIATELGVDFENVKLKVSELVPGMKKANLDLKVLKIFPVREFERNGRAGKVANLMVADDSGSLRVVLWDINHIELIEKSEIKEGDVIEIRNGSAREGEVHLSNFSEIKKSNVVIENVKEGRVVQEKNIDELQDGQNVKVRGLVVQLFNPRFFYVCPECGKKATQEAEGYNCQEHGKVQPKERALLNLVLDDGTESIRTVLFSDQIEKLIPEETLKDQESLNLFRDDLMGKEVYLSGQVRTNKLFGNVEIICQDVEIVDVDQLILELEK
jgi:ssDNA-binding replication factor A large subunit